MIRELGGRSVGRLSIGQRPAGQRSLGHRSLGHRSAGHRSAGHRSLGHRPRAVAIAAAVALSALATSSGAAAASSSASSTARLLARSRAVAPVPAGDWPITECGTYSGTGCAPTAARVDLIKPTFSNPTKITNPLFPVSRSHSVLQLGQVGGKPFRSETTLLPGTGSVEWDGKRIRVVLSQYLAYLDGRIEERALDRYAQADDGGVWYLGEDVFDYADGAVSVSEGTWRAGRDGPPAMIMPGTPKVGDVFRAENNIGVVFEEIRVKAIGQTVQGPTGPISGAITVDELKLDGSHSEKIFAPGYGEFRTSDGADVEALAVAAPIDMAPGPLPTALQALTTSAWGVLENARLADWDGAAATVNRMNGHWGRLKSGNGPPLVAGRMDVALGTLTRAVKAKRTPQAAQAAIDVAQAALDLQLRSLPVARVDVERIHLHTQQLRVYAAAKDLAGVTGEVAVIEWISERIAFGRGVRPQIETAIRDLRSAVDARNLVTAADHAARLASRMRLLT